jgi:hypothetical protein
MSSNKLHPADRTSRGFFFVQHFYFPVDPLSRGGVWTDQSSPLVARKLHAHCLGERRFRIAHHGDTSSVAPVISPHAPITGGSLTDTGPISSTPRSLNVSLVRIKRNVRVRAYGHRARRKSPLYGLRSAWTRTPSGPSAPSAQHCIQVYRPLKLSYYILVW